MHSEPSVKNLGDASPLLPRGHRSRKSTKHLAQLPSRAIASHSLSMMQGDALVFLQDESNVRDAYPKLDPDAVCRAAALLSSMFFLYDMDEKIEETEEMDSNEAPFAALGGSSADVKPGADSTSTLRVSIPLMSPAGPTPLMSPAGPMVRGPIDMSDEFQGVLMFKRRAMISATMLHFAIWCVSEFGLDPTIIEMLLDNLKDPDDMLLPAVYPTGGPKVTYISAVHLAAALGQVEILKFLTAHACYKVSPDRRMTPTAYVSQWAQLCPAGTSAQEFLDIEKQKNFQNFYQPIHDSTYAGNGEVTLYLLRQLADPCTRNKNQITPLHFVAFVGIQGGLQGKVGEDLERIVGALQRTGKAVGMKADMKSFIPGASNVSPLEVAVADSSRFPQDHLGLLAPCLADTSQLTYFEDIKRIADVTAEGALKLVRNIAEKGRENHHVLRRFRLNAQMEGNSDVLASIFYTAPLAAGEILDLLEVEPEVEDNSHHSIPGKASLWGFFQNKPMRTTYQPDVVKKEGLMLPHWQYQSDKDEPSKKSQSWHHDFIPVPRRQARSNYIKNVSVVVSLMPGVLDIDVFMAFAHCQHEHLPIMNQKTVQASITCLWSLIENVWLLEVVYRLADMWAYVAFSGLIHEGEHLGSICWPIIAAGNILSLWTLGCHVFSVVSKSQQIVDDPTRHEMWSPLSKWNAAYVVGLLVQTMLGSFLVLDLALKHTIKANHRDKIDDILLAVCLLMSCFRFIWMWRLSVIGSRIYTIGQTFLAAAVNQMLFITFLLLFSFIAAMQVLSRLHSWKLAIDSYRGFLFGDGDGFNGIGMNVDHDYSASFEDDGTLLGFSIFGSFFFNVIVLNIIIAIYSNEYDRVEQDTPLLFMKGRADYCVKTLLSCYVVKWRGTTFNRVMLGTSVLAIMAGVFVVKYLEDKWISALLLAGGQALSKIALVQCSWFHPEGQDSSDNNRYLWICHPPDWQWQAEDNAEFEESLALTQEQLEKRISSVDDKMIALDEKIDRLLKKG